jgi:hypothetical protein
VVPTKQLTHIERGWRDFKGRARTASDVPLPRDRIRAHVQLCWLALLLLRVIENATGDTWRNVRHELDRMALVTLAAGHGRVAQRSALTAVKRPSSPRSTCPSVVTLWWLTPNISAASCCMMF